MKRDFRTWMLLLAFSLPVIAALFIGSIYLYNCGLNAECARGNLAPILHTPVPTLIPATLPTPTPLGASVVPAAACKASAQTVLAAWVSAGSSQDQPFSFMDLKGNTCKAVFSDIQPLFIQPGLWYPGALACTACHNSDLGAAAVGLDLGSYSSILAGYGRPSTASTGTDILGNGHWDQALLNQVLFVTMEMPMGAPAGSLAKSGPFIQAGQPALPTSMTATPAASEEVPEPSNPGLPGAAVNLVGDPDSGESLFKSNCASCHGNEGEGGISNPGSSDETVPPLNPIDPLLKDPDYKVFASNIDLFIQHGSVPEGPSPFRTMPGWGDQNALTQQQIANVITYIISLNK